MKRTGIIFGSVLSLCIVAENTAMAASINGLYLRKNDLGNSQLQVFDCGGGKGVKVAKSTHKPSQGKIIMCDARPEGDTWVGKILNLEDGKHYDATISLVGDKLKIRGCVLGGVLCRNQFMPRVK